MAFFNGVLCSQLLHFFGRKNDEPMAGTDLVGLFGRGALLDAPPVWLPKAGVVA
jgi:hypothetical protein